MWLKSKLIIGIRNQHKSLTVELNLDFTTYEHVHIKQD